MKYFGLLGRKLSHSMSVEIHNHFFEITGIKGNYELFEKKDEKDAVEFVRKLSGSNFTGLNVTIPYKETVIPLLDYISPEAQRIGAVNTILFENGKLKGYNTDYFGIIKTFETEGIDVKGRKIITAGYGGTAKTVITCLKDCGAEEIIITGRNRTRAQERFPGIRFAGHEEIKNLKNIYLFVNCTPSGMYPDVNGCPIDTDIIDNFDIVTDLLYNPWETVLLKNARHKGKKAVNGMCMLTAQGVKAQEIWNDTEFDGKIINMINNRIRQDIAKDNIILTGMPGSGKTKKGQKLAEKLKMEFVDADEYIEKHYDKIDNLFEKGEQYFRQVETDAIRKISKGDNLVIATGGGAVTREENMDILKKTGKVFFIDRPLSMILNDIETDSRPLLREGRKNLIDLYDKRYGLYKKYADYVIEKSEHIDKTVERIERIIKNLEIH